MAREGKRKLEFRLDVVSATQPPVYLLGRAVDLKDGIYCSTKQRLTHEFAEPGYDDHRENHQRIEELTIKLAMAVSAVDGAMDEQEGAVIREWLHKRVAGIENEERRNEEKQRYNGYVQSAYEAAKANQISLELVAAEICDLAGSAEKYDALELCLHVAGADNTAEQSELDLIRSLARQLDVNYERLRSMEEKILPIAIHATEGNVDEMLGITPAMSTGDIRKHLNREYRKWNDRQSSNDPDVREQAIEMLRLIAESRRRHVG